MPTSSEQELEIWIALRKQTHSAHLTPAVMKAIQDEAQPIPQTSPLVKPKSKPPSWLIPSACFLAGVGKLSLVFHLAF